MRVVQRKLRNLTKTLAHVSGVAGSLVLRTWGKLRNRPTLGWAIPLTLLWIVLASYLGYGLIAQVPRDYEAIEFTGAIHDEVNLEATVGSSSAHGIMSVTSSELILSGKAFRPWPIELRITTLPLSKWGLPVAPPNPLLDHTIYSREFNLGSATLISDTEFDDATEVNLTIKDTGYGIDLFINVPKFVPRYDATTRIYSADPSEEGTFSLPPLERLDIKFKLPAWANGMVMEGEDSETWKIGNPSSSISASPGEPGGQPLRLFLAAGDVSNALKGNIYYNPISPPIGYENNYAREPTAIEMGVSSRQMPFYAHLREITSIRIRGLGGEVPAIGKRFTADNQVDIGLLEGDLEIRGISYWEKEYYEGKSYELKFEGKATSFSIDGTGFIRLQKSQFNDWPAWLQILVVAYLGGMIHPLLTMWRKACLAKNIKPSA